MSRTKRARRAVTALVATITATLLALVLGATPAQAAFSSCNSGEMCLFEDSFGGGAIFRIYGSLLSTGVCYDLPGYFNDITTSVYNHHATRKITVYSGYSCANDGSVPVGPIAPGGTLGFAFPSIYWAMDNRASAYKLS